MRFIPAGAGNTSQQIRPGQPGPVYPRWRGEHGVSRQIYSVKTGLSPLARGTRDIISRKISPDRFIPAGAGNTRPASSRIPLRAVYPRWRGEHGDSGSGFFTGSGLSPLARGTRPRWATQSLTRRFIPAGAGNTQAAWTIHVRATVYPRWRGEHGSGDRVCPGERGLSPLARGTP